MKYRMNVRIKTIGYKRKQHKNIHSIHNILLSKTKRPIINLVVKVSMNLRTAAKFVTFTTNNVNSQQSAVNCHSIISHALNTIVYNNTNVFIVS